jgi:hypothetical protein
LRSSRLLDYGELTVQGIARGTKQDPMARTKAKAVRKAEEEQIPGKETQDARLAEGRDVLQNVARAIGKSSQPCNELEPTGAAQQPNADEICSTNDWGTGSALRAKGGEECQIPSGRMADTEVTPAASAAGVLQEMAMDARRTVAHESGQTDFAQPHNDGQSSAGASIESLRELSKYGDERRFGWFGYQ